MATLSTAGKNAVCDALVALLQSGATFAAPLLSVRTAANISIITSLVSSTVPSWGAASNGRADLLVTGLRYNVANVGAVVSYLLIDRNGSSVISQLLTGVGDVGSGSDIEMNQRTVTLGKRIRVESLSIVVTD